MQRVKTLIKKVVNYDIIDVYKEPHPKANDFSYTIHCLQSLPHLKKTQFFESLTRKLQRQYTNLETLNLLILCDFVSGTNPHMIGNFPDKLLKKLSQKCKVKSLSKEDKVKLAEVNFNYFYLEYLREKVWKIKELDNISINQLQNAVKFCDSSLNAMKLVLRHDFIIEYALLRSEAKQQLKIAVQNILRRASEDLAFIIRFINKWSFIIVQNRLQSVMVNNVYEQLIFVSKNSSKFQYLNNKIGGDINFPKYELSKSLNSEIEKSMIDKESVRREFYSQKRLMTEGNYNQDQGQITQSEIFVKIQL